jgi:hypothetical protein
VVKDVLERVHLHTLVLGGRLETRRVCLELRELSGQVANPVIRTVQVALRLFELERLELERKLKVIRSGGCLFGYTLRL